MGDDFRPVGPFVGRVIRRLGLPDARALARLEEGWDDALGPAAPHARLVRAEQGTLVVEVDHPVWTSRVRMARGRLEKLVGEPVSIEVRVRR